MTSKKPERRPRRGAGHRGDFYILLNGRPSGGVLAVRPIAFANRFGTIDSNFALDGFAHYRENRPMEQPHDIAVDKLQILVLERRDRSCNLARFYVLAIEPTLFGDVALIREWGRLGSRGRRRLDLHADGAIAAEALEVWLDRKVRRGYQVRAPRAFRTNCDA